MPPRAKVQAVPDITTPYPVSIDSVYVTGSSLLDALKRTTDLVEKVLASDQRILLEDIKFDTEDSSCIVSFAVPGPRGERWLTKERLAEILQSPAE